MVLYPLLIIFLCSPLSTPPRSLWEGWYVEEVGRGVKRTKRDGIGVFVVAFFFYFISDDGDRNG